MKKYIKMTEGDKEQIYKGLHDIYRKPLSKKEYTEFVTMEALQYNVSEEEIERHIQTILRSISDYRVKLRESNYTGYET